MKEHAFSEKSKLLIEVEKFKEKKQKEREEQVQSNIMLMRREIAWKIGDELAQEAKPVWIGSERELYFTLDIPYHKTIWIYSHRENIRFCLKGWFFWQDDTYCFETILKKASCL